MLSSLMQWVGWHILNMLDSMPELRGTLSWPFAKGNDSGCSVLASSGCRLPKKLGRGGMMMIRV